MVEALAGGELGNALVGDGVEIRIGVAREVGRGDGAGQTVIGEGRAYRRHTGDDRRDEDDRQKGKDGKGTGHAEGSEF